MGNADPALTFLKEIGYSVVRLPRADVKPLQLLVQDGARLTRLGELATVLRPGPSVRLPHVVENAAMSSISGQRTRDLSSGVGLSILGGIIGAMGGSKLGLDVTYKRARTLTFEFADVVADQVELAKVDQYLTDADVSPFSTHVSALLEADAIYVTTGTLKTRKYIVDAKASDGTAIDIGIPEIQGVVGGNVKVAVSGGSTTRLAFEGAVPLVFGFQAARLFYDGGRYTAFKPLEPGQAALEGRAGGAWLHTDSSFVRLDSA